MQAIRQPSVVGLSLPSDFVNSITRFLAPLD